MAERRIKSAHEIRRSFIDFFRERGHVEVPGSPLVPKGDPTLLFTSAGMVQFKEFYLSPDNLPYTRATSVQRCLRAGDLESVGKTLRHHTFFEMLGNFSFGDYFKREAIRWAWEYVIELLRLPADRLSVSVFEEDDEAHDIWRDEIGLPAERIVRLGRADNFWGPVGKTGVCGPCSEMYYDTGEERGCARETCAPGCDCDRFLEFWNLVFPQFFLDEEGRYRRLEKPGIDTGLGLERLATIMQGVPDNFHTDLFRPLVDALRALLPRGFEIGVEERMGINMAADHTRALTFAIAEGVYPSNEGRGYLLRRLLRRALTKFYSYGVDAPFLHTMVDVVVDTMRADYPELEGRRREAAMIIRSEEQGFFRTIEDGRSRFAVIVEEAKRSGTRVLSGGTLFNLYDTYGFPLELTKALAEGAGLGVDEGGFEREMEEQRRRAQDASSFAGEGTAIVRMTEVTRGESSLFVGYERIAEESALRSYRVLEGDERRDIARRHPQGSLLELIVERTPFYARSGGQAADRGWIEIGGRRLEVRDVYKRGGEIVHLAESSEPAETIVRLIEETKRSRLGVDDDRRVATASNHTATHLLHAALRAVVGSHVTQAGSLVDGERLRFDFNHFQPLRADERIAVEREVNRWVRDAIPVRTELMPYAEAVKAGAIALFDEKYGAEVRVVRVGDVSVELCGGTHVDNTGRIGLFLILSESGVAAGIRRIEAVTGARALEHVRGILTRDNDLAALLKTSPADLPRRAEGLLGELDAARKRIRHLERGGAAADLDRLIASGVAVGGVLVASGRLNVEDLAALRAQADLFRDKVASGVAVLSAPLKEKLQFVAAVTDDLVKAGRISADALVRELGDIAGGGGGGKKHLALFGTKRMESEEAVFKALPAVVRRLLGG